MARLQFQKTSPFSLPLAVGLILWFVAGDVILLTVFLLISQAGRPWIPSLGIWGVGAGTAVLFVCIDVISPLLIVTELTIAWFGLVIL